MKKKFLNLLNQPITNSYLKKIDSIVSKIKTQISCGEDDILERIEQTITSNKEKEKEIDRLIEENQKYRINKLIDDSASHSGIKLIISKEKNIRDIKDFGASINEFSLTSFIAVIGTILKDKPMLVCAVSSDIQDKI